MIWSTMLVCSSLLGLRHFSHVRELYYFNESLLSFNVAVHTYCITFRPITEQSRNNTTVQEWCHNSVLIQSACNQIWMCLSQDRIMILCPVSYHFSRLSTHQTAVSMDFPTHPCVIPWPGLLWTAVLIRKLTLEMCAKHTFLLGRTAPLDFPC